MNNPNPDISNSDHHPDQEYERDRKVNTVIADLQQRYQVIVDRMKAERLAINKSPEQESCEDQNK